MNIHYAQTDIPKNLKGSIFLAGPTPRNSETISWRNEAIHIFSKLDFKGHIFIPEMENGSISDTVYKDQIEWEEEALNTADTIMFWVPRELSKMPAFTTNIEFGVWITKDPSKLVLGSPTNAPNMSYLRYYAAKLGIPSLFDLEESIITAMAKTND